MRPELTQIGAFFNAKNSAIEDAQDLFDETATRSQDLELFPASFHYNQHNSTINLHSNVPNPFSASTYGPSNHALINDNDGMRPTIEVQQPTASTVSSSRKKDKRLESNDPKVAIKTKSSSKQTAAHLPDWFHAHNPREYSGYQYDCTRAYSDYHGFIRNSLQKHKNRGDFAREGIPDKAYGLALGFKPAGALTRIEHQIEHWKEVRKILFKTPLSVSIPRCIPDDHTAHKAKRGSQNRKGKQPATCKVLQQPSNNASSPDHSSAPDGQTPSVSDEMYTQLRDVHSNENHSRHQSHNWPATSTQRHSLIDSFDHTTGTGMRNLLSPNLPNERDEHALLHRFTIFQPEIWRIAQTPLQAYAHSLCSQHQEELVKIMWQILKTSKRAEHESCSCCVLEGPSTYNGQQHTETRTLRDLPAQATLWSFHLDHQPSQNHTEAFLSPGGNPARNPWSPLSGNAQRTPSHSATSSTYDPFTPDQTFTTSGGSNHGYPPSAG